MCNAMIDTQSHYFIPVNRIYSFIEDGLLSVPPDKFKVLDFGFGSLSGYFILEIKNQLAFFKGIDEKTVNEIEVKWERDILPENEPINIYEKYLDFVDYHNDNNYQNLFQKEFHKKFELILDQKIESYIDTLAEEKVYNLLVLSNILHFLEFDSTLKLFEKAKSILNDDGIIYIQLITEDYSGEKPNKFTSQMTNGLEDKLIIIKKNKLMEGQYEYLAKLK